MLLVACVLVAYGSVIPTFVVAQTTSQSASQTTSQATTNTPPETTTQALESEATETNQGLTVTKQVVFRGINERLDLGSQRLRDVSRFDVSVRQSTGEVMLWVAGSPSYHFFDPRNERIQSVTIPSEFTDLRYRHMITRDQPNDVLIWDNAGGEIASFNLSSRAIEMYTEEPARKSMIGSGMVPVGNAMVFLGGYGFWETHNTIAKFDREGATWSAVKQSNPLPSSMSGVYFKGRDQALYTLIPNADINANPMSFDGFKVLSSKAPYIEWKAIHEFSSSPMSARKRNPNVPALHLSTPDYMLHGLVVESEFTREGHFEGGVLYYNARDNEVRTFYNPDLGAKHRLLTMFYLDIAESWVIMSQLHNNDDVLYFSFVEIHEDGTNATLHANGLQRQKRQRALQATAAGLGSTALLGFLMFFRRQRARSWAESRMQQSESNGMEAYQGVALHPIMDQDSFVGVVVDGQEEDVTRDGQYQKFWALLLDAIRRGQESIPLQDIDEAVFHTGVKQPQRTRSRARFVERINTLAGAEILQIARSPVDRRYRVLQIQHEAIRLISDSLT
ncbi:MAG: hypothetical protein RI519_01145 [Balneolaceae bacterium]|nr:hypothetical protein [Balneolaceae bacterium]